MLSKDDYEILKSLPYLGIRFTSTLDCTKAWYASEETTLMVARILNSYDIFPDIKTVLYYFEKPYKWEMDIIKLINEYEGKNK